MPNYAAKITGHGLSESKVKGTPSIKFSLETLCELESGEQTKKTFYADLWLSGRCIERTCATLRDIGFQGNDINELNDSLVLVGTEIEISTEFEDYNGSSCERVRFINRKGAFESRGVKPLDSAKSKSIASSYNQFLRNAPKSAQAATGSPARQTPATAESADDLPF